MIPPAIRLAFSFIFCAALAMQAACKSTPVAARTSKVPTGPATLTQARTSLEGKWTLVSMDVFPPHEQPILRAATGTMIYDKFANLTVELHFTPEATRLAERVGIPISNGTMSTTGRTVIDLNNHSLSYVLEGQAAVRPPTGPLDTNRPRYWEVNGNTLTLRTKDADGAVLMVSVWHKT
jgi:hypothetical protein